MLSNNEKYIFTSELALAISNGLQVEDGLKMLVGFDADVSICAKKLEDIMKQGYSFTDALKESKEFDEYMIQMVVVGQSIGNLDVVFKELSTYYARQKELNYQIQDAITYPFVLILMMFVIVATLIFKVFPIFENILSQMSMSLSLMYSARILSYIGFFILLFILVFGLILYFIYKDTFNKLGYKTKINTHTTSCINLFLDIYLYSEYRLIYC